MAKFSASQTDFSSGEVGDKLSARTDLPEYKKGLKKLRRFFPMQSGGATRCPGTRFLGLAANTGSRLIPYDSGGDIGFVVIRIVGGVSTLSFLKKDGTTATIEDPSGVKAVWNTLGTLSLEGYRYAQSGEILFITHTSGTFKPVVIGKAGASVTFTFVLEYFDASPNRLFLDKSLSMPFIAQNVDTTKKIRYLAGPNRLESDFSFFTADQVGSWVRLRLSGGTPQEGVFLISGFTDDMNVTVSDFALSAAWAQTGTFLSEWLESAWSDGKGWPKTVSVFQQRTVWGGNNSNPDTIWASRLENLFFMTQQRYIQDMPDAFLNYDDGNLVDTDPFSFFPSSGEANDITWITSQRSLHMGTSEGEYVIVEGSGTFGALLSFTLRQQTSHGSAEIEAVKSGRATLFVSRDGKRIRNFLYSEENGSYFSQDVSVLSEDIINFLFDKDSDEYSTNRIKKILWDENKKILWVLTTSGALVGASMFSNTGTVGWHGHPLGQSIVGTNDLVEDMGVIVDPTNGNSELYISVIRDLNGAPANFFEIMGPVWEHGKLNNTSTNDDDVPYFLDSSKTALAGGIGGAEFSGYDHLNGKTVQVLEDGITISNRAVVGGIITIPVDTPAKIIAGLPYVSTLQTLNIEAGAIIGSAQPLFKNVNRIMARLYKSVAGKFGFNIDENPYDIEYPIDTDAECGFSGDVILDQDATPGEVQFITIQQDKPLPLTILGLFYRGETED